MEVASVLGILLAILLPFSSPQALPDCSDPFYADLNPEVCAVNDCSDAVYAELNPLVCGVTDCSDAVYAELNPEVCAVNDCSDAVYADLNPEVCAVNDCSDAVYADLNPEVCGAPDAALTPDAAPTVAITAVTQYATPGTAIKISVSGSDDVDVDQLILYDESGVQVDSFACPAGAQKTCSRNFMAVAPDNYGTVYSFKAKAVDSAGQLSGFAVGSGATIPVPPVCVPSGEVCDGLDNDCNDEVDDGEVCGFGELPPVGCAGGFLDSYRCDGGVRQREQVGADCSRSWSAVEVCAYGCGPASAACNPAPVVVVDAVPSATIAVPASAAPGWLISVVVTGSDDNDVAQLLLFSSADAQVASFDCLGVQTSCSNAFTVTVPNTYSAAYSFKAKSKDSAGQLSDFAVGSGVTSAAPVVPPVVPPVCVPSGEVCDGLDNDCNDEVDDGVVCGVSEPPPVGCAGGFLDSYRCDGGVRQREQVGADCSRSWSAVEVCAFGCGPASATCNPAPVIPAPVCTPGSERWGVTPASMPSNTCPSDWDLHARCSDAGQWVLVECFYVPPYEPPVIPPAPVVVADVIPSVTLSVPASAVPGSSVSIAVTGSDDNDVAQLLLFSSADAQVASFDCLGVQTSCSNAFTVTVPNTYSAAYSFKAKSKDSAGQLSGFAVGSGVTSAAPVVPPVVPPPVVPPVTPPVVPPVAPPAQAVAPAPLDVVGVSFPLQPLFMRSVGLADSDCVKPGESAILAVKVQNTGREALRDVRFTASVPELGIYASDGPVKLTTKDKSTRLLAIDVPEDAAAGSYMLRFTVSNNKFKRSVHRDFVVSDWC